MQDPKINSHTRKPWYQRAKEMATQWRMVSSSSSRSSSSEIAAAAASNSALLKSDHRVAKSTRNGTSSLSSWKTTISSSRSTQQVPTTMNHHSNRGKLKKSSSLRVVTSSFTARVCLCAPISSYNEVFRADVPPRRSYSYPRSKPFSPTSPSSSSSSSSIQERTLSARRISTDQGRRVVFRGKSLTDDVLMKRFVLEEEAMMQIRRRNEMEVIRRRRRSMMRRSKLGPSPLSRMVLADHQVEDDRKS